MTISTHTSIFVLDHDTDECTIEQHGAYTGATSDVMSISVHDVVSVKRHTRRIRGGTKVTTITIRGADGGHMTVDCFMAEGEHA
jgi:hypothetical protein